MAPGLIKYFPKGKRASLSSCQAESTEGKRRKSRTEESSREQEAEEPAATKTVGLPPPKCNSKSGHRVSPQPETRRGSRGSQGILQSHHAPESPKPRPVQQCLSPTAGSQGVRPPLPRIRWAGNTGFRENPPPRKH